MSEQQKLGKAVLIEKIEAICPYCGAEWTDVDPGWRNKPSEKGISYEEVRCERQSCQLYFLLDFNPL